MIIDILPEILLINRYINFIATVEHNNIWGYMIRAIPSVFIGDTEKTRSREKKGRERKEIKGRWKKKYGIDRNIYIREGML